MMHYIDRPDELPAAAATRRRDEEEEEVHDVYLGTFTLLA